MLFLAFNPFLDNTHYPVGKLANWNGRYLEFKGKLLLSLNCSFRSWRAYYSLIWDESKDRSYQLQTFRLLIKNQTNLHASHLMIQKKIKLSVFFINKKLSLESQCTIGIYPFYFVANMYGNSNDNDIYSYYYFSSYQSVFLIMEKSNVNTTWTQITVHTGIISNYFKRNSLYLNLHKCRIHLTDIIRRQDWNCNYLYRSEKATPYLYRNWKVIKLKKLRI